MSQETPIRWVAEARPAGIRDQASADFQERQTICLRQAASAAEEAAYQALLGVAFTQGGQLIAT